MIKNDLRSQGFNADFKEPKESPIVYIWTALALGFILTAFLAVLALREYFPGSAITDILDTVNGFIFGIFGIAFAGIYLFSFLFLYLALKIIMTVIFCKDKKRSTHLKVLKGKGIPICVCKEALKIWQIILIYLVPAALVYITMIILCALSQEILLFMAAYMVTLFFLIYYMALDLTLILYIIYYKIKEGADYISVDLHIFQMTVFSKAREKNIIADKEEEIKEDKILKVWRNLS